MGEIIVGLGRLGRVLGLFIILALLMELVGLPGATAAGALSAPVPSVTGAAKVGARLTAVPGRWGPAPVTLRYQWLRAGLAIPGATAATYIGTHADRGKTLSVRVAGSKTGYTSVARTSRATAVLAAGTLTAPVPTVTGSAKVGSRLTASPGAWGPAPVTLRYQWLRSGVAVDGATGTSYITAAADNGKVIAVRVTGAKTGYGTLTRTSKATGAVGAGPLTGPTPTVTGTAREGFRLTANSGTWGPGPVTLKYQWLRAGTAISGATAPAYMLAAADAGKPISVRVTGTKAGYTALTKTSTAVATSTDTLASGSVLHANNSLLSTDGRFRLIMQGDGNLVAYGPAGAVWDTATSGAGNSAVMQTDGNLVVYTAAGKALWGSGTDGLGASSLVMQNDGNLVIYTAGYPTWARHGGAQYFKLAPNTTLTANQWRLSVDRRFRLIMQGDGNLVQYGPNGAVWATATSGAGNWAAMQGDGNLVVYTAANRPVWDSRTAGLPGAELHVQADGNLVIYQNGKARWTRSDGAGAGTAPAPSGGVATAIAAARGKIASGHYVWGGTGPTGFDCSGLVQFSFAAGGIAVPRTASQQYAGTANNRILLAQAQPGDLVFFGSPGNFWHVGIYSGNGKMINAMNPAVGILELPINQLLDTSGRPVSPYAYVARY
jgi:cell wall-associated NlpC family hydrolase